MAQLLNSNSNSNITNFITSKIGRKLHNQPFHPIEIMKRHIYNYFKNLEKYQFNFFDDLDPIVSIEDNFDKLLIPIDHPARSKSDTYYVDETHVLRTHTSAHQNQLLAEQYKSFIVTGDVYRKDEIDARHYPVFHQMEIFTLVDETADAVYELKQLLSGLIEYLFGKRSYKFNDDYFPFTNPSFEIEVEYNNNLIEVLGCGVVEQAILQAHGLGDKQAIACGLGLDRLAMIFAEIPDIRYLWSTHGRFLCQFTDGNLNKFQPYSILNSISKDISFYVPNNQISDTKWTSENDFFELLRNIDIIEKVELLDQYHNTKLSKYSKTYRLIYSPCDPNMKDPGIFNNYVNDEQQKLRIIIVNELGVELR